MTTPIDITRRALLRGAGSGLGAMAMAAGEWVSVSSQADIESADRATERRELLSDPIAEKEELTNIYVDRGLSRQLAEQVAEELSNRPLDQLVDVHARDELGLSEIHAARPGQAAVASALSFTLGGLIPFLGLLGPFEGAARIAVIVGVTIIGLMIAGQLITRIGYRATVLCFCVTGIVCAVFVAWRWRTHIWHRDAQANAR